MVPASVGLLVLDARVRQMDLLVEVRRVVLAGPFLDLVRVAINRELARDSADIAYRRLNFSRRPRRTSLRSVSGTRRFEVPDFGV
ncbi:MAG: hypothetical protein ABJA98_10435 [Acidobacteriota bacterium]